MAALHTKGISRSNKINVFWDKYGITLKDNYTVPVLALLDERLRPTPVIQPGFLKNSWLLLSSCMICFQV